MSDDYRWQEIWRRMEKVEKAAEAVPVMAHDIAQIKTDVAEVRDESRSLRRAFFTLAGSIMAGSVTFAISVFEIFK